MGLVTMDETMIFVEENKNHRSELNMELPKTPKRIYAPQQNPLASQMAVSSFELEIDDEQIRQIKKDHVELLLKHINGQQQIAQQQNQLMLQQNALLNQFLSKM